MEEVIALQQLVGELREGEPIACLAVQALFHTVLGHHVVHRDMFAHLACKIEEGKVFHPVVVVDQFGGIGCIGVKVEEMRQLLFDALHVVAQHLLGEQVTLCTFSRRVTNHAGSSSHECQRFVAGALEVPEHHHGAEVSDMEGISCGVNAHVCGNHLLVQQFFCAGHHLVEHTAPFQFFNEIHLYRNKFDLFGCKVSARRAQWKEKPKDFRYMAEPKPNFAKQSSARRAQDKKKSLRIFFFHVKPPPMRKQTV